MALFSEYFDFVSWSLARRNLKFGGFSLSRAAAPAAACPEKVLVYSFHKQFFRSQYLSVFKQSLKYTILYLPLFNSLTFQTKLQSAMLLLLFSIQFFSLFTSVILDHKFATLEFFAKNTTCNRHQFQKFQKNTQIHHGISL